MKQIKQLTFNITQSRRIKNYAKKLHVKEEELLKKYRHIMHIVFQAWDKNYSKSGEVGFREFFLTVMKYAEFAFRLKERYQDLETINRHVDILKDALEEYETDYTNILEIEKFMKEFEGGT